MIIKFDKPSNNGGGGNTGSSAQFLNYMEKEQSHEQWFGYHSDQVQKEQVLHRIDEDRQGIRNEESRFYTGSINLSEDEFKALGSSDADREKNLKQWVQSEFTQGMADNFTKQKRNGEQINITADSLKMFYKMERKRHYKGIDPEVKSGEKKSGELKEGFQTHIHFIIARKTKDKQYKVSPTTTNRKEFDRTQLFDKLEKNFDKNFSYHRKLEDTFDYRNTLANGTAEEKIKAINQAASLEQNPPLNREQQKALENIKLQDLAKQRIQEIEQKRQDQNQSKGKGHKM